jgi:adenine-specific DNA-methyltransferase
MDEIFGRENYRNWITRKKCNPKNYTRKTYGNISDFILFYTKSDRYIWNRAYDDWTPERAEKEYQYIEERTGRRYKKVPLHAPGVRIGETGKSWRGMNPPPGKHWQFVPKTLDEMDARGEIYWSSNDNPRRKIYLDESQGIPVQDIWLDFRDAHNQNIEITGYPTEKPPELLARIISASSNPGDLVLDCFSGSGTILAASARLGRRWIGVDSSPAAISATLRRFAKGLERMGDFVSQRKPPSNGDAEEMLPLFAYNAVTDTDARRVVERDAITDFALWGVQPYTGELDVVLDQWRAWL